MDRDVELARGDSRAASRPDGRHGGPGSHGSGRPRRPVGPPGPAATTLIFVNRNCTAPNSNGCNPLPLAAFPGVTVASLTLPPGDYVITAKFRYAGLGGPTSLASCVYQSAQGRIGGLDSSANNSTATNGQVDGHLMDTFSNNTTGDVEVHVPRFGTAQVGIINPQFSAIPGDIRIQ